MELEFVGYEIEEPKYSLEEARIHDASFSAPIFVDLPFGQQRKQVKSRPKKFSLVISQS